MIPIDSPEWSESSLAIELRALNRKVNSITHRMRRQTCIYSPIRPIFLSESEFSSTVFAIPFNLLIARLLVENYNPIETYEVVGVDISPKREEPVDIAMVQEKARNAY